MWFRDCGSPIFEFGVEFLENLDFLGSREGSKGVPERVQRGPGKGPKVSGKGRIRPNPLIRTNFREIGSKKPLFWGPVLDFFQIFKMAGLLRPWNRLFGPVLRNRANRLTWTCTYPPLSPEKCVLIDTWSWSFSMVSFSKKGRKSGFGVEKVKFTSKTCSFGHISGVDWLICRPSGALSAAPVFLGIVFWKHLNFPRFGPENRMTAC